MSMIEPADISSAYARLKNDWEASVAAFDQGVLFARDALGAHQDRVSKQVEKAFEDKCKVMDAVADELVITAQQLRACAALGGRNPSPAVVAAATKLLVTALAYVPIELPTITIEMDDIAEDAFPVTLRVTAMDPANCQVAGTGTDRFVVGEDSLLAISSFDRAGLPCTDIVPADVHLVVMDEDGNVAGHMTAVAPAAAPGSVNALYVVSGHVSTVTIAVTVRGVALKLFTVLQGAPPEAVKEVIDFLAPFKNAGSAITDQTAADCGAKAEPLLSASWEVAADYCRVLLKWGESPIGDIRSLAIQRVFQVLEFHPRSRDVQEEGSHAIAILSYPNTCDVIAIDGASHLRRASFRFPADINVQREVGWALRCIALRSDPDRKALLRPLFEDIIRSVRAVHDGCDQVMAYYRLVNKEYDGTLYEQPAAAVPAE